MLSRTALLSTLLAFGFSLLGTDRAAAQPRPYDKYVKPTNFGGSDSRSKAVQDLLKDLISKELEARTKALDGGRSNPNWLTPALPPKVDLNLRGDDLLTVRRALADFAREADRLMASLTEDAKHIYGLREHYTEVLKIRARASYLSTKAGTQGDLRALMPEIRNLDQSWRLLAFKLSKVRGLSRTSIASIRRMSEDIKSLDKVLHIDPQIDRVEIVRQTAALTTALNNFGEDIRIELGNTRVSRELQVDCRRIEQHARYLSTTVTDRANYRGVASAYRDFDSAWHPFLTKVWKHENRYLERSIRRVNQIDARLRELLFLPKKANKQELLHLTTVLKRDVDNFFLRAPLKLLIELERKNEVLSTSDQFYGYCQHFTDVVTRGEETSEVEEAYGYIEEGWREFYAIFRPMKSQAAHHVLSQIEKSMQALKSELGLDTSGSDIRKSLALAASVESLASHLESDIRDWLNDERPFYARTAMTEANGFTRTAQGLHRALAAGPGSSVDSSDISRMTNELLDGWRRVYGYIIRCKTNERGHLLRIAGKITPQLVDLRAVLGDKPQLGVSLRSTNRP